MIQYYGTLGPACGTVEILEEMLRAGMTGARLNLSHGDLEDSGPWINRFFAAAESCGATPELLIDLRGPELRIGGAPGERLLETGEEIVFGKAGVEVPGAFFEAVSEGDHFLLDDGKLEFSVVRRERERFFARTVRGGELKPEKSLALVGKEVPLPALAESDYKNIRGALKFGVTGVMLPFVRGREDLMALRRALEDAGAGEIRIFAKIENMRGVRRLDSLLPYADYIVIARGDLGNAMPLWELPRIQKQISRLCRERGKPFMVVTQMLDSMTERAVPTRAEVSDIYNAVLDGASSLMLTGETAVGKYPALAMEYLVKTAGEAVKAMAH